MTDLGVYLNQINFGKPVERRGRKVKCLLDISND